MCVWARMWARVWALLRVRACVRSRIGPVCMYDYYIVLLHADAVCAYVCGYVYVPTCMQTYIRTCVRSHVLT